MATTIGIRELKLQAPRLVKRAARGEKLVITHYGKPVAVIGPIESPPESSWQRERAAFERLLPKLGPRFKGKYVAVSGGRVVGSDASHERLFHRVERQLGDLPFFIGAVRKQERALEMPGFALR